VRASGAGGVFPREDRTRLTELLRIALERGKVERTERRAIAEWSSLLTAERGATYLLQILAGEKPAPPWARPRNPLVA
jgi:hypothetical protein